MTDGEGGRMPAAQRERLIAVAAAEFASAGYDNASLNRIIRACGMSKSSFYNRIASKHELFDVVVRELSARLAGELSVPEPDEFAAGDFWVMVERVLGAVMAASEHDESFIALGRMFYLSGVRDPEGPLDADGAISGALVAMTTWLARVLEVGRASGAVRDDLPPDLQYRLVFAVLRTLDEWTLARAESIPPEEGAVLVRAQFQALRRLLAPDAD